MDSPCTCLVVLLALLMSAHCAPDPKLDNHWKLWVNKHQKSYKNPEEEITRRAIWEETLNFITVHNLEYSLGLQSYEVGMNHLGDMTGEEVSTMMAGDIEPNDSMFNFTEAPTELFNTEVPYSIDWRTKNCVTKVKDQGQCGSCWAFGSIGSLECQVKKKTGKLVSLSEQNLVDCSASYGNNGCNGGYTYRAFKYIRDHGIEKTSTYPYKAKEGQCHAKSNNIYACCSGYTVLPKGDESKLKQAVGSVGPITVSIDASREGFRMYKRGVYTDKFCSSTKLGHAVLVIGYGVQSDIAYWLVKNSWGMGYGEKGYIKMARNRQNQCGIATRAVYPIVK
ncbi:cathepsin S-like [Rhinophrynus dorsalis]